MSESMSRYSIIERLTDKKLALMEEKGKILESIELKKQKLEEMKSSLNEWESNITMEVDLARSSKTRQISVLSDVIDNLVLSVGEKEKLVESKIKALDKSLAQIQEISKSADSQS